MKCFTMLKSSRALSITLLLALVLFLFTSCTTVNSYGNYHMYPQCESTVYSAKIMGKGETTVYTFPEKMTELTFTCLAHVVNSSSGTGPDEPFSDICYASRFDPFPYSFLLRITHTDSKGKMQHHHHNIKISDSGSTVSLTYQVTQPSTFELVFVNNATVSNCELNIRVMFTYNSSNSYTDTLSAVEDTLIDSKALSVPALVGLGPSLLHLHSYQTYLALYHDVNDRNSNWENDIVTLVDYTSSCENPSGVQTLNHMTTIPSLIPTHDDDNEYISMYTLTFTNEGFYRLCYRRSNEQIAHQSAVLRVFATNPSHYEISANERDNNNDTNVQNGKIIVGDEATIAFYGYKLWPGKYEDDYAFVAADGDCATGRRAAEEFNFLKSDMCPGNNCLFAYTNFLLTTTGVFKVCYYHMSNRRWDTIPSFVDIGPGTLPDLNNINTTIPTPIDPVTHEECTMASPSTPTNPWMHYNGMKLIHKDANMPPDFVQTLYELFCVPISALNVAYVNHTDHGNQALYFIIDCEGAAVDDQRMCDSTERYNYIVQLQENKSSLLSTSGIMLVEGITTELVLGEQVNVVVKEKLSLMRKILIICIFVTAIVLAVYAVKKYKDRRVYFMQFNMNDEDINDMYSTNVNEANSERITTVVDKEISASVGDKTVMDILNA